MLISFIFGIYRDRGVAEHSFGAGGGYFQTYAFAVYGIIDMPEVAVFFGVLYFRVRKRGFTAGTPIYYTAAAVNKFFIVQIYENFPYRFGAFFVHGKGKAGPVARRAELFELLDYPCVILVLPLPYAFQKAFASQTRLAFPFRLNLLHDLYFGCD